MRNMKKTIRDIFKILELKMWMQRSSAQEIRKKAIVSIAVKIIVVPTLGNSAKDYPIKA